jgi:O-antigen/teichoic acid export membrane protein
VRTIINVLANWVAFILGTAITFVLSPFVVHHLGDTRYGLWAVAGSVVGYLGLLDLGIRVGVTRFVAQHEAKGDREAANRLVTTALGLFAVVGAVALLLGAVISAELSHFVHTPPEFLHEASVAVFISGVTVGISLVTGVYGAIVAGLQRFALLNTIDLSGEVIRAIGTFVALSHGGGLISLAVLQLVVVILRGLCYIAAARQLQPWLTVARRFYDRVTRKEIIHFSTYTTLLHVSAMVVFSSDALVIAAIMPVSQVAFFVIAGNLSQAALQVLSGVSRALYPLISARQATGGVEEARTLIRNSVRLSTIILLPIVFTFLTRGRTFIGLWMGPSYAGPAGQVLEILALGLCVFASYQVLTISIMALALHRGLVPAYLGEAILNIGLSFVLGAKLGVAGVAWGTTIPRIALAVGFAPWYCRRKLDLGVREYAMHAWLRPLASILPFGILSLVVDRTWPASNLLAFFSQVALLLPIALVGTWMFGLESAEREQVRSRLRTARAQLPWFA